MLRSAHMAEEVALTGLDFVMAYREASAERAENLYAVLRHIRATYKDYGLWLIE